MQTDVVRSQNWSYATTKEGESMAPSTRSGNTFEQIIEAVLKQNYPDQFRRHIAIGHQLFGGKYIADFVLDTPEGKVIISAKWQQVSGTAEQKLLYEIASLIKIVKESSGQIRKAYVVLDGPGFSKTAKSFLLKQGHVDYLQDGNLVEVLDVANFTARANQKTL